MGWSQQVMPELEIALDYIDLQIRDGAIKGVIVQPETDHLLNVLLEREELKGWIGFRPGKGYFLVWSEGAEPSVYFTLPSLTQALSIGDREPSERIRKFEIALEIAEALDDVEPDLSRLSSLVDALQPAPEAIDALASIAAIKNFRIALDKFREMLGNPDLLEVIYHEFLAKHPWLLGTHYTEVIASEYPAWFNSRVDLMLLSAFGSVDIIELKRPTMEVLQQMDSGRPKRSGLSSWKISPDLSAAFGQARKYIRHLDENRLVVEEQLGLRSGEPRIYRPRVIIVAGHKLDPEALRDLHDINTSDGRILVFTYDDLLAIGEATIRIFEKRIGRSLARPRDPEQY